MHEGRLTDSPGMIASNEAFVEEKAEQAHWYWNGVIKYVLILISKTGVGLRLWKKSYMQIPGKAFSKCLLSLRMTMLILLGQCVQLEAYNY